MRADFHDDPVAPAGSVAESVVVAVVGSVDAVSEATGAAAVGVSAAAA